MTTRHLLLALSLAGCFGAGPVPAASPGVDVVYEVTPPEQGNVCQTSRYLGPVAIADDQGYVIELPYTPPDHCTGNVSSGQPLEVVMFAKSGTTVGGAPFTDGAAGNWMGVPPWLATRGTQVVWSYFTGNQQLVGPPQAQIASPPSSSGSGPNAIWLDDTAIYGAWGELMMGGLPDSNDPQYPSGGEASSGGGIVGSVPWPLSVNQSVQATGLSAGAVSCAESRHCAVATATAVYYVVGSATGSGSFAELHLRDKATGNDQLFDIPATGIASDATLVGMDSDGSRVAFAFSPRAGAANTLEPGCWIFESDGAAPVMVFGTTRFTCRDLALAGDALYFTIVHGEPCDCGNPYVIHGDGIGRISLAGSGQLESLAIPVAGRGRGARRVYADATGIYLVDPFTIARLDPGALDGKHDFSQ